MIINPMFSRMTVFEVMVNKKHWIYRFSCLISGAQKMTKKENGRKENDLHMTFMIFYKENDRKNMTENK